MFQESGEGKSKDTWTQDENVFRPLLQMQIFSVLSKQPKWQLSFPASRFFRFGLVGLSGLAVDMTVLYLFHKILGLGLTRSAIFAAEIAIINNFFWNDRWTFRDLSSQQKGKSIVLKRLLKFNVICLMGLILKVLLLNLLFNGLDTSVYLANLLAIIMVAFWNFWINMKLSWRSPK